MSLHCNKLDFLAGRLGWLLFQDFAMADMDRSRNQPCNGFDSFHRIAAQGAFPDDYDPPSCNEETLDCGGVSFLILGELFAPEIDPGAGQPEEAAIGVGMPETTVDEYRRAPPREY